MASRIDIFAPAKINLFLHVGEKRPDGFHELESLVVFVDAGDRLTFEPADSLTLKIGGPFGAPLAAEADNLILRAARALAKHSAIGVSAAITLTKNLPVASGIGGGSADAAAALRGLVQLWKLDVSRDDLQRIAAMLGSDVPVCVDSRTAWMESRGEIVTPVAAFPSPWLVLVNPGVAVPTAKVFAALKARTGVGKVNRSAVGRGSLASHLQATRNDLEAPALEIAPVIGDVLAALRTRRGAHTVRMSGSGATCFAIFESSEAAQAAADATRAARPDWWVAAARVLA
ncbi:MAG TPA: 4-(cytidine 5'-diphospho)-2-C-methyl-D-erythritol kinase [Rhizomicrobium sp.]|nr:4-(cytidine 5'-diphospho)-2-C-methyl-D-erythritol kinase [Rhizomicrobium sp.]